jgi:hypothetical protein
MIVNFITANFIISGCLYVYSQSFPITVYFFISALILGVVKGVKYPLWIDIFLLITLFLVYFTEKIHYPNYFFSSFHLLPDRLAVLAGFILGLKYFPKKPVMLFITAFGLIGIVSGFSDMVAASVHLVSSPGQYSQSFVTDRYGKIPEFIKFITRNTSEKSTLVIPPPLPGMRLTGDLWLMNAWGYPRKIIQYYKNINLADTDYIIVSSETDAGHPKPQVWPDFDIPCTTFLPFEWNKGSPGWGLLKLDHSCIN